MGLGGGTYGREAMDWADREICSRWFARKDMLRARVRVGVRVIRGPGRGRGRGYGEGVP